jgi:hypothetical protein
MVSRPNLASSATAGLACARMDDRRRERKIDPTRHDVFEPGDEQDGAWSRDRLLAMDQKFCKRVERAVRDGREHMSDRAVK